MPKKKKSSQLDSYRISDIEQVKALAHPLRMRIIEALAASEPMTTKQVAASLGEKPTRLYHHVGLLEKAGLIRLMHTRKNRGTTEKYYEAIARQFRAATDLFSDESTVDQKSALRPMIRTVFDNTLSEMLRLLDTHRADKLFEDEGLLSYVEMHLSQEQIDEVREKLKDILQQLQSYEDPESGPDEKGLRRYRLMMAHYPLDRFD
ncbi:MAG: helix-turn-helix domain-containing protein [Gammaproteobacteria bacterium]|nr:helix-turn-helix domain-containing protein [Gammaproteobacteria bacterium]MDH5304023.1 helix-turn-helix domain-containing protein [Gammaproteobacteria bacterium]MDH5321668.1 helix-turn-helix domain-containing protein [Gammaproteobacteria bacterium]